LLGDASPLVRGAAIWALAQLLPAAEFAALREGQTATEPDRAVQHEWRR
jgi:epoxyqueuosine reductase